jgi:hypothetical protein
MGKPDVLVVMHGFHHCVWPSRLLHKNKIENESDSDTNSIVSASLMIMDTEYTLHHLTNYLYFYYEH